MQYDGSVIYLFLFSKGGNILPSFYHAIILMTMKEKVFEKIQAIEREIDLKVNNSDSLSLFTGIGGAPIFYYLMFVYTGDKRYISKIKGILEKIANIINDTDCGLSYCDGLAGVARMFNYLKNKNILDSGMQCEMEESLLLIDHSLADVSIERTNSFDDTDFLHGSFGIAFYLIGRIKDNSDRKFIDKVILIFEKIAELTIEDIEKSRGVSEILVIDESTHRTNCGLAHGHISHMILFSIFLKHFPENNIVKVGLQSCVACVLSFESMDVTNVARFPSISVNKHTAQYNIPLGWCYGDQTISIGLLRAAEVLVDGKIKQKALSVAFSSSKRDIANTSESYPNYDAGFCHGFSSIAYLNKKWYRNLGKEIFKLNYERYIKEVIDLGSSKSGIAGYRKYKGNGKFEEDTFGFLDGIIGIGIVLIDYLLEENDTGWDSFFLLSELPLT